MDEVLPKDNSKERSGVTRNLISGFAACGLVPFNPDRVLQKLPGNTSDNVEANVADSLTDFLKTQRYNVNRPQRQRKKLLHVEPGKSVAGPSTQLSSSEEENENIQLDDNSEDDESIDEPTADPIEYFEPTLDNIIFGKFVLVKFLSGSRKKTEFRYVCLIQKVLKDNVFEVVGLKSAHSRSVFKLVENDVSTVQIGDIVALLPDPKCVKISDRIIRYHFPNDINIKEC
ncbi:hypothetical protein HHI36_000526 [Cryptolaemus montrouzieri]|uniref:Uncharacterized protein n=1 Tax=Cryptolaemus montrouzieri TaxID=559131 RepID=A0ABD2P4X5_9CUCU